MMKILLLPKFLNLGKKYSRNSRAEKYSGAKQFVVFCYVIESAHGH